MWSQPTSLPMDEENLTHTYTDIDRDVDTGVMDLDKDNGVFSHKEA